MALRSPNTVATFKALLLIAAACLMGNQAAGSRVLLHDATSMTQEPAATQAAPADDLPTFSLTEIPTAIELPTAAEEPGVPVYIRMDSNNTTNTTTNNTTTKNTTTATDNNTTTTESTGARRKLSGCSDMYSYCASWAQSGYCAVGWAFNGQSISTVVCPLSCQQCSVAPTPVVPATGCADQLSYCASWASGGYCDPKYFYGGQSVPNVVCRASCGTCGNTSTTATTTTTTTTSSQTDSACQTASLSKTNVYRARHQAPAVAWDATLTNKAQSWANHLVSMGCTMIHSGSGENLFMRWPATPTISQCGAAVDAWYNEFINPGYQFTSTPATSNPFTRTDGLEIGHFTQLVWVSTQRMGCAEASNDQCTIVACEYDPPGNYWDNVDLINNVKPPV